MNIGDIRSGIKTRLDTISGLRNHAQVPDLIETPAGVVGPPSGSYVDSVGPETSHTLVFPVFILVPRTESKRQQDALDDYIDDTGSKSVKAAIEAGPTLGGACDSAIVVGWENYGAEFTFNDTPYIGVQFNVEVYA